MKLLFFILISPIVFSQNKNFLRDQDTIYVYFKQDKYLIKEEYYITNEIQGHQVYYYFYLNKNVSTDNNIAFLKSNYLNYEKYRAGIKADVKTIKKKHLKKLKERIIDIDFLNKIGKEEFLKDFSGKTFYIIDSSEIKNGKSVLREVILSTVLLFNE